jgi:2-octaprenyl-6-methoxyphenol hydroxylase
MALDERAFLAEVERRFGHRLGNIALVSERASWPLDMHLAHSMATNRIALVGDAAHGVHPIAGQGLNLGIRDIAALTEVVVDAQRLGLDIGHATVLERYERWRRLDNAMSTAAFDAVNAVFSAENTILRSARGAGMGLIDQSSYIKQLLVTEAAGLTGDIPKLLRGEKL